jgi:CheY-like chemotaxis protein
MRNRPIVLIIDDDEDDRLFFTEAISVVSPEADTYIAENGLQGLKLLNEKKMPTPDYIFLDLNMPVMNGKECLKELVQVIQRSLTKVIIMSTSSLQEDMDDAMDLGAQLFISKPHTYADLCQIVTQILKGQVSKLTC